MLQLFWWNCYITVMHVRRKELCCNSYLNILKGKGSTILCASIKHKVVTQDFTRTFLPWRFLSELIFVPTLGNDDLYIRISFFLYSVSTSPWCSPRPCVGPTTASPSPTSSQTFHIKFSKNDENRKEEIVQIFWRIYKNEIFQTVF